MTTKTHTLPNLAALAGEQPLRIEVDKILGLGNCDDVIGHPQPIENPAAQAEAASLLHELKANMANLSTEMRGGVVTVFVQNKQVGSIGSDGSFVKQEKPQEQELRRTGW